MAREKVSFYALVVCIFAPIEGPAAEEALAVSIVIDYSEGDFGTDKDTQIIYAPFTASYRLDAFSFSVTAPYLHIEGPGVIIGGGEGGMIRRRVAVTPPAVTAITAEEGLGDIVARAAFAQDVDGIGARLSLSGAVKFPTADEGRGLGTGEFDFSVYGQATKYFDFVAVYAGAGYRFLGDSANLALDDVFYFSVGAIYELSPLASVETQYRREESATGATSDPSEIVSSLHLQVTDRARAELFGLVGLSNGSPDFGAGLRFRLDL